MAIGLMDGVKLLALGVAANLSLLVFNYLRAKPSILGRTSLSLATVPGQVAVTVKATVTASKSPIEYLDLSYYVNEVFGGGVFWGDYPDSQGPTPGVGESRTYTWTYIFPAPGSYVFKGRTYLRNTDGESLELFTDPQTVIVEEVLSATVEMSLVY